MITLILHRRHNDSRAVWWLDVGWRWSGTRSDLLSWGIGGIHRSPIRGERMSLAPPVCPQASVDPAPSRHISISQSPLFLWRCLALADFTCSALSLPSSASRPRQAFSKQRRTNLHALVSVYAGSTRSIVRPSTRLSKIIHGR